MADKPYVISAFPSNPSNPYIPLSSSNIYNIYNPISNNLIFKHLFPSTYLRTNIVNICLPL